MDGSKKASALAGRSWSFEEEGKSADDEEVPGHYTTHEMLRIDISEVLVEMIIEFSTELD